MQQERPRSESFRETIPLQNLRAPGASSTDASPGLQLPQNNLGGATCVMDRGSISLQEASLGTQKLAVSFPAYRVAPAQNLKVVPPPTQLELDKLELEHDDWTHRVQLRQALEAMHQAVHSLVMKVEGQQEPTTNNNDNNTNDNNNNNNNNHNTHNNNHTNNTNNTNDNNNNRSSRESGLNSLDLDNENPESEPDLDSGSLFSFNPRVGVESSLGSLYQHEAEQSFSNKGEQTMTKGFSLGSFTQEGMMLGTTWDPSLEPHDPSSSQLRDKKRPQKRVSFDEGNLAYNKLRQNTRKQGCIGLCPENVQLRQLAHKKRQNNSRSYKSSLEEELPEQDTTMTTTKTCWTKLQQEDAKQQQPATTLATSLARRRCITTNLGSFSEEDSIGSLEQNASATNWPAYGSQEHNNNSLGIGTKNTATFGILIDTGAAISVAPKDFASQAELSPLESTLQLRTITGKAIKAFGRRTVQLVGSELNLCVSFVIAEVDQALIGMDILIANRLSLLSDSFHEYYLVNSLGAKTRLQQRGLQLYMPACPQELGLRTLRGSSFQTYSESLLDDKGRTQEASGGACATSFDSANLRPQQDKNTAALGTASPTKGARKRRRTKKKKPLAEKASPEQLPERSLEQEGQSTAASQLRNSGRTSLMKKIELAAEESPSLETMETQELSLRILLTLSLRKRWLITTARATCSQEALGEQLRSLDQNKVDNNLFGR